MRTLSTPLTLSVDGSETCFRLSLMDAFSGACLLKLITEKCLPHFASLDFSDPQKTRGRFFCLVRYLLIRSTTVLLMPVMRDNPHRP